MSSKKDTGSRSEDEQRKLPNAAYTVGWICALPTEHVAARVFLDQEHAGPPPTAQHDNNSYALGSIGEHNVVIAVMPSGEYGTASAAGVARDMLSSFTNIRIGLMVGIGGGAPTLKIDIRLGDVVVSEPGNGLGGVYQYDFGKNIQDEPFLNTRFLAPPPPVLLTAISGLKSTYEMDGHCLNKDIERILAAKKRLKKKYSRPDGATDRLFKSNVIHVQDETCCTNVDGSDEALLVWRSARDEEEDDPAIHYGLIASGNSLIKDAHFRDAVAKEKNVLCFEMEAGGLMNHFPCLVIRGICDYSDSHKNKDWQGYAAMTAAAYAKDLLLRVSPARVEDEQRLAEVLSGVDQGVQKLVDAHQDHRNNAVLAWLTPVDYASEQNTHFRKRQEGTGQWLLDCDKFQQWLRGDNQTLFCPGIPGAGKTVLMSIVINYLQLAFHGPKIGIAYIYLNYKRQGEQRVHNVLENLVKQLASSQPSLPKAVQCLYEEHSTKHTRPSTDELLKLLQSLISMYSKVYIAFDALDESAGQQRDTILSLISRLKKIPGAYIFATSRFIQDIENPFDKDLRQDICAVPEDVARYVSAHISELPYCVQLNKQLQQDIEVTISEAVDGMFLLAQIYVRSLADKLTPNAIKDALQGFKRYNTGSSEEEKVQILEEAYNRITQRIDRQKEGLKILARQTILWITCAKRQLTVTELRHALAVKDGTSEFDSDDLPQMQDIISVCAGLVTVDDCSNIIRMVHYTTEEYFRRALKKWFPQPQSTVAKTCVTYLSYDEFETGACESQELCRARLEAYPFYSYASHNWGHHARESDSVEYDSMQFLKSVTKVQSLYQAWQPDGWFPLYFYNKPYHKSTALHLVATFGVLQATAQLLQDGRFDIQTRDHLRRTPLALAARSGHASTVEYLLNQGASIDVADLQGYTPLSLASEQGDGEIVRLLLDRGAVIGTDDDRKLPLCEAARCGHEGIVRLLLDKSADINLSNTYKLSPLYYAANHGQEAVARLLLDRGADINSPGTQLSLLLYQVTSRGYKEILQLLLDRGADIEVVAEDGESLLHIAASNGHETIVQMLLGRGADIEAAIHNESPLCCAVEFNQQAIVKLLLDSGANIKVADMNHQPLLCMAAEKGYKSMVQLLLDYGAHIEVTGGNDNTALFEAAEKGYGEIAQLLLERGASIDAVTHRGDTPLLGAARSCRTRMVDMLLDCGANLDKSNKNGRTALHEAILTSNTEIVQLLLDWGTSIDTVDKDGQTALHIAASYSSAKIVQIFIDLGLQIDAIDKDGSTPLHEAVFRDNVEAVRLLLDMGANINTADIYGTTPLIQAIQFHNEIIVKLLLDFGIDVNTVDRYGRTPLDMAKRENRNAMIQLLVSKGAKTALNLGVQSVLYEDDEAMEDAENRNVAM